MTLKEPYVLDLDEKAKVDIDLIDNYIRDLELGGTLFIYSIEPDTGLLYKVKIALIHRDKKGYRVAIAGESNEERRIMIYADALKLTEAETESGDWIRLDCSSCGSLVARYELRVLYRVKIEHADGEEQILYQYDSEEED